MLDTVVFVDEKAIEYFTNDVLLVKINADSNTALKEEFHISGLPTTVLINKDGSEVDRIVGFAPTEEFIGTLDDYTKGIGTLAALLDSAASDDSRQLAYEIAEKYKWRGGIEDAVAWYNKVTADGMDKDSLGGEARMAIGDMYRRDDRHEDALGVFVAVTEDFSGDEFGAWGQYWVARCHLSMADTAQAIEAFQVAVDEYADFEVAEYAQGRIDKLTGVEETE